MRAISILVSGLLFGMGVTLSGMVDPLKVLNFMDITGTFDPTLLFVMGAGLVVTVVGYRIVLGWQKPILAERFHLPVRSMIDARLLAGAALFGIGWGLSGFCPGPAVASLVFGHLPSVIFVAAMAAGMIITRRLAPRAG